MTEVDYGEELEEALKREKALKGVIANALKEIKRAEPEHIPAYDPCVRDIWEVILRTIKILEGSK